MKNALSRRPALWLAAALVITACSPDKPSDLGAAGLGQVELALTAPDGSEINQVLWKLRKGGNVVQTRTAPVLPDGTATVVIGGVAAGGGYSLEMIAQRSMNKGPCEGKSAEFEVRANQSVAVRVSLQCGGMPPKSGGINATGDLNFCPQVGTLSATPASVPVGSAISVFAQSQDPDGDAVTYAWTAPSGTFANPSAASTSFTCASAGPVTLSVAVNDGQGCVQTATIHVTCAAPCGPAPTTDYRKPCQPASEQVLLASGLSAAYVTREIANNADQYNFWPHGSKTPTHLLFCIEGSREVLADGRLQPGVQSLDLATKKIHTILRGTVGCDGLRTTPWGTVLATEEFADDNGGLYEILYDPSSSESYSISERGANGAPAVVVDSAGNDASAKVIKRIATPSMAWEGLAVLPSGVIIGGDEERPGSRGADADGGAIFKFIPTNLRTATGNITSLAESPLVAGTTWALQVTCVNNTQQVGQGCEVGQAAWVPVDAAMARPAADAAAATGFYRPEDLELDPHFAGPGVRFCFANTGNAAAANYGEIVCAVDSSPNTASATARTVVINRFVEGDEQHNQPDNVAFHPTIPGLLFSIEDTTNGDVWACLPDGADRDIKSDGCVRLLSVRDRTAEPTGFIFAPDGHSAYLVVQHSRDRNMPNVEGYATDDLLVISGFSFPDLASVDAFGTLTEAQLIADAQSLFGFSHVPASASTQVSRVSTFPGGVAPTPAANGIGGDASALMSLAPEIGATYLTRTVAQHADQFEFWPLGSPDPTHLVWCIESSREVLADGRLQPSVQAVDIKTGAVKTIVRGMVGCDGLRVSPWGTLLATEEFADDNGAVYEILWSPASTAEYSISDRGANGAPALIVDQTGADATSAIIKRTALASMAWEGLLVLPSGVVIAGDEERPGSRSVDSDGGAIFKFVPAFPRTASGAITDLAQSPLVDGKNYALQASCVNNAQQFGQGCEIGNAAWVPVGAATARPDADIQGATGFYRPEDLERDPNYTGEGVRFCVANTGNAGAANYGEVVCGIDRQPLVADGNRTVVLNRLLEGDTQLNAPDNLEFQAGSGNLYVIEDSAFGDVWACLPDGDDRDIKSDGCIRLLSLTDRTAEPTGFKFHPDGTKAYVAVQHSTDPSEAAVDGYATDDIVIVTGFKPISPAVAKSFGGRVVKRLNEESAALFGFGLPLASSAN